MTIRVLILVLLSTQLRQADAQLLDTISMMLEERPRVVVKLDGRGSFVSNQHVRMLGFKIGLDHGRRFQYGIGYNYLRTKVEGDYEVNVDGALIELPTRLKMGLITPYVEYAFYQRGPWQVSIPVQFGIGSGYLRYDYEGQNRRTKGTFLLMYEPAMTVQYRFLRYFGVSAGLGYRLVFKNNEILKQQMSAPVYLVGLKIFFDDLWKDSQRAGQESRK